MKTDLSKFQNRWFKPENQFKIVCWYMANQLFVNTYIPFPVSFKSSILKFFGCKIGAKVVIKPKVNIKYPWFLTIGDYAWIGEKVWIDNLDEVTIGAHACLSQGVLLLCGNHNYKKTTFDLIIGPIDIEDGVWIGAQSVVCAGVTCKSHSVLTVGSIATKSLEAYSIYQGNPAIKIHDRIING